MFSGYNWFLIIIAVVVSVLAIGAALYLLIVYQHPEDRNQVCHAAGFWTEFHRQHRRTEMTLAFAGATPLGCILPVHTMAGGCPDGPTHIVSS